MKGHEELLKCRLFGCNSDISFFFFFFNLKSHIKWACQGSFPRFRAVQTGNTSIGDIQHVKIKMLLVYRCEHLWKSWVTYDCLKKKKRKKIMKFSLSLRRERKIFVFPYRVDQYPEQKGSKRGVPCSRILVLLCPWDLFFIYHIYPTLCSILPQTKLEPGTVTAKSS